MNDDFCGPVTTAEVLAVVEQLQSMSNRAADNGQGMFHFVLAMAAESMADNIAVAAEGDADGL